jgi:hypothetical protein
MNANIQFFRKKSKGGDCMKDKSYVLYKGKKYVILYQYSSGFCEIKEVDSLYHVEFVHSTELMPIT